MYARIGVIGGGGGGGTRGACLVQLDNRSDKQIGDEVFTHMGEGE